MRIRLVELLAVDVNLLELKLDGVSWQSDDPLDEIPLRIFGMLEYDDVSPTDRLNWQHGALERRRGMTDHELVDEQMIAHEKVRLHRAGGNLERLHDERADEERERRRNDERLEVLADDR